MVDLQRVLAAHVRDLDPSEASPEYEELYTDVERPLASIFAVLHEKLNGLFRFMNTKMTLGRHFNADASRDLIAVIAATRDLQRDLKRAGIEMWVSPNYEQLMRDCKAFLVHSGGSPIPEGMVEVPVERFAPVFGLEDRAPVAAEVKPPKLELVGEGSFAVVHRFVEPTYGMTIAVKRAKPGISDRDLERFRMEFDLMRRLNFPYIVRAYTYDASRPSFTMEHCDETLGAFIRRTNQTLSRSVRKRIALQFLYGLNYLHAQGILHRDISRNNVLIQHFDRGAVLVKLSDFGLHKEHGSDFTRTSTELKGTIQDPLLESFRDFTEANDIYAAGAVVSFIFSGRHSLGRAGPSVDSIVAKATHPTLTARYRTVAELIQDVEALDASEGLAEREVPA